MPKVMQIDELRTVSVVGVGLLGGSIGLAFRAAGGAAERVGVGRRRSSITKALDVGAVDRGTLSYRSGIAKADLVIIATPIGHFETVFRQLAEHLSEGTVITDVGSTKRHVMRLAEQILPSGVHFVGSHPMAGSEAAGVEFARADLFQLAQCMIVPPDDADQAAVGLVEDFWRMLGMRTRRLTAERHDAIVAQISHLPHVVASALMDVAAANDTIDFAATGFADTTRVASGSPGMWLDILMSNREDVGASIDQLTQRLQTLRAWLDEGKDADVAEFLERTKLARDDWVLRRYAEREIAP